MLNQRSLGLGNQPNKIRELFAYGLQRKAQIGADKVFDFSIGNPSVPTPAKVTETLTTLLREEDPVALHGYTPSAGAAETRAAVVESLARRFGIDAKPDQVYMTTGAAAALAISLSAVCSEGDEVIVPTPYFPEYGVWAATAGASMVEVPCRPSDFQLDVPAMAAAVNEKTAAVIINSPNNPVGSIYSAENLTEFCDMLAAKEQELGHPVYLISDEPYREITYGDEVPFVPDFYEHTIICYSYSKSLSLPGERIGYIYVSNKMGNAAEVTLAVQGAGRALGYVCASSLFQKMVVACVDEPSDVEAYRANRELLTGILDELGYEYIAPQGAFYLWTKALEADSEAFCERAKDYELLLVPATCFRSEGWVRISYCVSSETIKNSKPAFAALMNSYQRA